MQRKVLKFLNYFYLKCINIRNTVQYRAEIFRVKTERLEKLMSK